MVSRPRQRSCSRCAYKQYLLTNYPTPVTPKCCWGGTATDASPPLQWSPINFCHLRCAPTTTMTGLSIPWCCLSMIYAVFLCDDCHLLFSLCSHNSRTLWPILVLQTLSESFWDGLGPRCIKNWGYVQVGGLWSLKVFKLFCWGNSAFWALVYIA